GKGDAGKMFVSVPMLLIDGGNLSGGLFAFTVAEGNGGDISVQVGKLKVQDGGQIFNGVGAVVPNGKGGLIFIGTGNSGHGGNLTVKATESILISGQSSLGLPSGLFATSLGSGNAGNIEVQVGKL